MTDTTSIPIPSRWWVLPTAITNNPFAHVDAVFTPTHYDPATARIAFDRHARRLAAWTPDDLASPNADMHDAALLALRVHGFVTGVRSIRERFESLARVGELRMDTIAELHESAAMVLLAVDEAAAAGALRTDAKVPAATVEAARAVEARMQRLCEYHFADHPVVGPMVAALRPGVGHRDLASDLRGYASIYRMQPDVVAADTCHFDARDADEAERLASEIMAHLSAAMTPAAAAAADRLQRAWTMLVTVYREVQSAGAFLLRHDTRAETWFPALYAAGRRSRRRRPEAPAGAEAVAGAAVPSTPAAPGPGA